MEQFSNKQNNSYIAICFQHNVKAIEFLRIVSGIHLNFSSNLALKGRL
jgi:hypothetical protein